MRTVPRGARQLVPSGQTASASWPPVSSISIRMSRPRASRMARVPGGAPRWALASLIEQLVMKTGISKEQAASVVDFLKQNAHKLPEWLGESEFAKDLVGKLPGGLGKLLG